MKPFRLIISNQAKNSLKDIAKYIKKESPSAAVYVTNILISLIKNLQISPEKFSKEPLLSEKEGNYRSVTKWHYKIIYSCKEKTIEVLDIIHTSRKPGVIKKIE